MKLCLQNNVTKTLNVCDDQRVNYSDYSLHSKPQRLKTTATAHICFPHNVRQPSAGALGAGIIRSPVRHLAGNNRTAGSWNHWSPSCFSLFLYVVFSAWQLLGSQTSKSQLRTAQLYVLRKRLSQGKAISFLWLSLTGLTAAFMLRSTSQKSVTKVSPLSREGELDRIMSWKKC